MRRDPDEWSNLAADPAYADTWARLVAYMPATDTPDLWQPPARRDAAAD